MLQSVKSTSVSVPTREELLSRAESMIPRLAARSADCEKARKAPRETVEEYADLGLLRICQPSRYGGYDLGYDVMCEVIQTLARGCGSQAWVHMVLADNPLKLAAFSLDAQDEVWGADSRARICVAIAAVVHAERSRKTVGRLFAAAIGPQDVSRTPAEPAQLLQQLLLGDSGKHHERANGHCDAGRRTRCWRALSGGHPDR